MLIELLNPRWAPQAQSLWHTAPAPLGAFSWKTELQTFECIFGPTYMWNHHLFGKGRICTRVPGGGGRASIVR